jgi:TRAP-type C4-dicarboxylate transport system permease small subunit
MTLQIGLVAVSRTLFGIAFDGSVEIAKFYYMVALSVLALGAVQAQREHVMVEVFTQWMSPRSTAVLDWCALVFTTIYASVLTWGCLVAAIDAFESSEAYRLYAYDLTIWPSRWVLAIGLFGFLLNAIYMIFSRRHKL